MKPVNRFPRIPVAVLCVCACLLTILGTGQIPAPSVTGNAAWIWHPDADEATGRVYLAKSFTLSSAPVEATYLCTADNEYVLYINGQLAGRSPGPEDQPQAASLQVDAGYDEHQASAARRRR